MSEARRAVQTPSRQTIRVPFNVVEVRGEARAGSDNLVRVTGYASVFDYEYRVFGGPPFGWIETVDRAAFDETLANDPDVVYLRNHEGMPLARTRSQTLVLSADDAGLFTDALFDVDNPEARSLVSGIDRGDVDEMSMAFRTVADRWTAHDDYPDDDMSLRELLEVNLHRGDVSAVTFGASDATSTDIVRSLDRMPEAEIRALVDAAGERLRHLTPQSTARASAGMVDPALVELLGIPPNPALSGFGG